MDGLTRDGAICNLHISINHSIVITIYVTTYYMICTVECVLVGFEGFGSKIAQCTYIKLTTVTHTIILHNRASVTDISTYVRTYMQWFT